MAPQKKAPTEKKTTEIMQAPAKKQPAMQSAKKAASTASSPLGKTATHIDQKTAVIGLFKEGHSVPEIVEATGVSRSRVYAYIAETRLDLLRQKKEHFDEQAALWLDDIFETLGSYQRLLSDEQFLRDATPGRIKALQVGYGIFSDKCFLLLAAGGGARRPNEPPLLTAADK